MVRKIWKGSFYLRNKRTDKWGNKYNTSSTYRNNHTGEVASSQGNFLGKEEVGKHTYGYDVKKAKKPKGWHGESLRHSIAARRRR